MLIKIENIPTARYSVLEELEVGPPKKHRDISWLCIDAVVYSWCMMSRDDVGVQMHENVDHCIVELPRLAGPNEETVVMEYDEVCLLEIHDPLQITVLFNTRAYVCNEKGDTIEKIVPKRLAKPGKPLSELITQLGTKHTVKMLDLKEQLKGINEPPCLKCGKKAVRLVKDGAFIGTFCDDEAFRCGEQLFEDWISPRVRKPKPNPPA